MDSPVREGDILGGKYRVDKVLGVGGMGVVIAATHLQLDQRVALKFMLPVALSAPDALARFQREAKAAVRLRSEHVARVLDTGTFESGSPYIVMEFLEGNDLAEEIAARRVTTGITAEYIIQACDAIAEAHAMGIVHRDLKPANLFVTRRPGGTPLVKVLDFGISKANVLSDGASAMTSTTAMMGSPLYMAPEQMKSSKNVDARADVWSLGVILYEMLGGQVPFDSDTLGGLMSQVMMEAHAPLASIRGDVPADLCRLVDRCLEKDPARRAASVAEIARGLAPYAPQRVSPIVERIAAVLRTSTSTGRSSQPEIASTALLTPRARHADAPPPSPISAAAQTAPGWGSTNNANGRPAPTGDVSVTAPKRSVTPALAIGGALALGIGLTAFSFSGKLTKSTAASAASASSGTAVLAPSPETPSTVAAASPAPPPASEHTAAVASAAASAPTAPSTSHARSSPPAVAHAARTPEPIKPSVAAPSATAPPTAAPATAKKPGILDTSN